MVVVCWLEKVYFSSLSWKLRSPAKPGWTALPAVTAGGPLVGSFNTNGGGSRAWQGKPRARFLVTDDTVGNIPRIQGSLT